MKTQNATILFELQYDPELPQIDSGHGRPGHYIGSGFGTASIGDHSGSVRWDLFEDQSPDRCAASFVGSVQLENGEVVGFETNGWLHVPDPTTPELWEASGHSVSFNAKEGQTAWLDGVTGRWLGTFDSKTYRHRYSVHI